VEQLFFKNLQAVHNLLRQPGNNSDHAVLGLHIQMSFLSQIVFILLSLQLYKLSHSSGHSSLFMLVQYILRFFMFKL